MVGMNLSTNPKQKAIALRKKGLSYNEIRQKVPTAKSTLSYWLKGIKLKKIYKDRLYTKKIHFLSFGAQSQKERRLREVNAIIADAKKEIGIPISEETRRLFGAALYWAEGTKGGSLVFTNSDPHLILFMVKWFEKTFNIRPNILKAHLNIYEQQNDTLMKKFWSDICDIPIKNFGKSYIKPSNKGYKKNNLYYGTIKIYVPKSTDLQIRVSGWVQKMFEDISPHTKLIQKKWERLKKVERPVNLR